MKQTRSGRVQESLCGGSADARSLRVTTDDVYKGSGILWTPPNGIERVKRNWENSHVHTLKSSEGISMPSALISKYHLCSAQSAWRDDVGVVQVLF